MADSKKAFDIRQKSDDSAQIKGRDFSRLSCRNGKDASFVYGSTRLIRPHATELQGISTSVDMETFWTGGIAKRKRLPLLPAKRA